MSKRRLSERAYFLVENLDLEMATGVSGARWEHFQLAYLSEESTFSIEVKSRQIAWSWLIAAEAVANAILYGTSTLFISINLSEAAEKIRYAKNVLAALPPTMSPKIKRDTAMSLELEYIDRGHRTGARIVSMPSKPPRGKSRFNVRLDEFAHALFDREIYTGSLPVISKGGNIRIGSSPLGASGVFWEIYSEKLQKYPSFTRKSTPWWQVFAFCNNVPEAYFMAPKLLTQQRVDRFGNDRIKALYYSMPEEDFRQEYECDFIDESVAWVTWAEIKAAQSPPSECELVTVRNGEISPALGVIDRLYAKTQTGKLELALSAGVDVGRTQNATELFIVGIGRDDTFPLRGAITMESCDFDTQETVLSYAHDKLPITKMKIDQNGIGRNLSETISKKYPARTQGETFSNSSKLVWATDYKMLIQQGKIRIPIDRDISHQIHSIKRKVTASNNLVFDTERNEKHHADKFWAHALAIAGAYKRKKRITW